MGGIDSCDHPYLGRCHGTHGIHLAEVAGGHLDDGDLMLRPQPAQGHGQSESSAVVARCPEHCEPGGQHVGDQLLGPGLAHRAGDRHHPGAPGAHHVGSVALHGGHGFVHDQSRATVRYRIQTVHQDRQRPPLQRIGHEVMPVPAFCAHGHEEIPVFCQT